MDRELILQARPCSTDFVSDEAPQTLEEAKMKPVRFCGLLNECTKRSDRLCVVSLAHQVVSNAILFEASIEEVMSNGFKKHFDSIDPSSFFVYFDGKKRIYLEKPEAFEEIRKLAEKFLEDDAHS